MRIFSFHNQRILRRVLLTVLAVLLVAALLLLCRFLYLSRYVVYANGEAYLDFDRTLSATRETQAAQDPEDYPFTTLIASQSPDEPQTQQRSKIQGYYITTNMLSDGVDAVRAALDAANDYDAVMIDVKSVFGNYYYRSKLSGAQVATSADIDAVEALIRELTARADLTVIARVPAFSEPNYAFAHQDQALALYSGALWMDNRHLPAVIFVFRFFLPIAVQRKENRADPDQHDNRKQPQCVDPVAPHGGLQDFFICQCTDHGWPPSTVRVRTARSEYTMVRRASMSGARFPRAESKSRRHTFVRRRLVIPRRRRVSPYTR